METENDGFEYTCSINTIFEYMQKEIEFALSNKLGLVTEFVIKYNRTKYNVNIWNNTDYSKNESENDIDIMLNEEHYKTLEDFMNNAQLNGVLIKDIKENIKVILTHHDSSYLEEHQIKFDKPINTKQFKYSKSYCNTWLFLSIFWIIVTILSRWMFKGQPGVIVGYIFFDFIAVLATCACIHYKRKKIVYKEKSFSEYGIFSKKTYLVSDIAYAEEKAIKGITIIFNNRKKVLIHSFMINYTYARRILEQNGIKISKI